MNLLRLSAIIFAIGILSLFLALVFLGPTETKVSGLGELREGTYVKVGGTVLDLFFSDSGISFSVDDGTGTIKVFIFSSMVRSMLGQGIDILSLENGIQVSVSGTLTRYHGELEVLPKSYEDVVFWK